ncbi:MAG: zinc ribbon domain-containing protein [Lentisphaeria bacterium]|nr:zinc ribbon domain-containing protein [Lentisphaeria bacterium]
MPIYEYKCTECDHLFAHLHRTLSEEAPPCPECGTPKPKKMFSTFSAKVANKAPSCPAAGTCPASSGPSPCCATGACPMAR